VKRSRSQNLALQANFASGKFFKPGDGAKRRRFPATGRTSQAQDIPRLKVERQVANGGDIGLVSTGDVV